MAGIISLSLPACGTSEVEEPTPVEVTHEQDEEKAVGMDGIMAGILQVTTLENMEEDHELLETLYDVKPEEVEDYKLYVPKKNILANELLIVKTADGDMRANLKEKMMERAQEVIDIFESYAPDQSALGENAIVSEQGDFILFVMDEKAEEINQAFLDSFK